MWTMLKVSKTLVKIKVGENCHPTTGLPNNGKPVLQRWPKCIWI